MQIWGASPEEWDFFDLELGLTADLLPVVSNPGAAISADSRMKSLGKTPSLYNRKGEVVGIADWTQHVASVRDVARWRKESDHGICLQSRTIRALDIDVPDRDKAQEIAAFIDKRLNLSLPRRWRADSGKSLLAFALPGEMAKRTIKVDGGIIEFLATGQQFVAAGTHPGGQRYQWTWRGHNDFPQVPLEVFEGLWVALISRFAIAPASSGALRKPRSGNSGSGVPDATADFLLEKNLVLDTGKEGQFFIDCPFRDQHTQDSGPTATAYFPKGSRGYEQGHFICLHAHCQGRTDAEFLDALGVRAAEFEVAVTEAKEPEPWPKLKRNKKGEVLATVENVTAIVRRADICGMEIRLDTFRDEVMFSPPGKGQWRAFSDNDYTRLRIRLERGGFMPIGRELMRDVVALVANDNKFDSATTWLESLKWDGKPRVETFLHRCFGADDTPYTRAVACYMWTAMAGRVMEPGIKADMVPILQGEQGVIKSTAISALVPSAEFFCEMSFNESDDNLARKMRGCLVAEIGELRGLHTKELESIKAFITRQRERWIPKYKEFAQSFPRRLVFIGTTNKDQFLADETGNRRWLPFHVNRADVEAVRREREQLWAEGREMFTLLGVMYQDAEQLAPVEHEKYIMRDAWEDVIGDWLDAPDVDGNRPREREFLRVVDVLREALNLDVKNVKRADEMKVGMALRSLGFVRDKKWVDGRTINVFLPTSGHLQTVSGKEFAA